MSAAIGLKRRQRIAAIATALLTELTLLVTAIVAILFVRGRRRLAIRVRRPRPVWRDAAFAAGLLLFALSSSWPLESYARGHYAVQQLAFLILRIAAPMLIALSQPAPVLRRGWPAQWAPPLRPPWRRVLRSAGRHLQRPAFALSFYVATLYLWAIPAFQQRALTSFATAVLLHASLFLSGLLFWGRIFDRRTGPRAITHATRLMMLWLAILGQILIGSAISLKSGIWYPAYGAALAEEANGGVLVWIPSSMLTLLGLIFVVDMWGRHETRLDLRRTAWSPSNSAILLYPETAHSLRAMTRPRNRRLALSMIGFAAFIFLAVVAIAIAFRLS